MQTWIVGKWITPREQSWAPKGTHFHQFVVPPILSFRRDCTYGELAAMRLPEDVEGLGCCEVNNKFQSLFFYVIFLLYKYSRSKSSINNSKTKIVSILRGLSEVLKLRTSAFLSKFANNFYIGFIYLEFCTNRPAITNLTNYN